LTYEETLARCPVPSADWMKAAIPLTTQEQTFGSTSVLRPNVGHLMDILLALKADMPCSTARPSQKWQILS